VSSLTQPSLLDTTADYGVENEQLRQEVKEEKK